jgi:hypothetical protein
MNAARTTPATSTVVVAGTAGGVGTTTIAALLFASFGTAEAPRLLDHSGGELGLRLTGGDDVLAVSETVALHDLGPHAQARGLAALEHPRSLLVAVTGATPGGLVAAEDLLAGVKERYGQAGLVRTIVVASGAFGRRRVGAQVEAMMNSYGRRSVIVMPRDRALAGGGPRPGARSRGSTISCTTGSCAPADRRARARPREGWDLPRGRTHWERRQTASGMTAP